MTLWQRLMSGWILPVTAITLIWVALFLYLNDKRAKLLEDGGATTANLAQAFEQSLAGTIHDVDQTLLFVQALRARDGDNVDLRPWLKSADPDNKLAAQIATTDRYGIVTSSNLRVPETRIDLSDRPHFRYFADHPRDELYISVPVFGRVSQKWTIQFVRTLKTASGDFDGIIVLSVPTEYLVRLYSAVDLGENGRISLIGLDGIIRARAGGITSLGEAADGSVVDLARREKSGHFHGKDQDGVARVGSFRRVAGYPLAVVVEMSERELTDDADQEVPRDLLTAALTSLLVIFLALSATRHRRTAEAAHQLTKLALEHVGVGIMVVNPAGRISMFNAEAQRMLGLPKAIAPGSQYSELIEWQRQNGELTPEHMSPDALKAKLGPKPWSSVPPVFRRTLTDGRIIETRTEALEDGTTVRSFSDITPAQQAQRALTEARDTAEAAVRARAQFFAAMSHEIRTPLNGILGVNDLLRATPLLDEQRDYVNIIQQTGTHLLEMLTEILDYSKIDQIGVELEIIPFDPAAVVRAVVAILKPTASANDLVLDTNVAEDVPRQVLGDPHRVRQVLLNLISNAIKFTPSGSVDVSLSAMFLPGGECRLCFGVKDTGIGIEPQSLNTLFKEFTQTDGSISRRFGGTGLGLAICKRVVDAMGGEIAVQSTPGHGSLFNFSIPVEVHATNPTDKSSVPGSQRDASSAVMARSPTVLLAEDNRVNRLVAAKMLERSGCKVITAENGAAAVAAVQKGGIDLVLMDVMMPEMDGLAATRAIRALPFPLCDIPIIGLSANAFRSDHADGRAAGMNAFLTKPIDSARLIAEIAAVLDITVLEAAPAERVDTPSEVAPDKNLDSALHGLRQMLGDEGADAVISAFCDDAPKIVARLREQVALNSATGAALQAHALAGTAGALELMCLSNQARSLEQAARREGRVPSSAVVAALEQQVNEAIEALRAVRLTPAHTE